MKLGRAASEISVWKLCIGFCALVLVAPALKSQSQPTSQAAAPAVKLNDEDPAAKLAKVKRIYVEQFGEDAVSKQVQAMVIDALTRSHKFIVTEKRENADAVFKGSAVEKTSQELHASSEATSVAGAAGSHSGNRAGGFVAHGAGIADSQAATETINDARLVVRLVSSDGDVLWSTTQESKGAKYKGATADAAEKAVKELLWDLEKLRSREKQKSER